MHNASHPEAEERGLKKVTQKIRPCNQSIRNKMLELREQPGWSNNIIAKKLGVNSAYVSTYLNEAGCIFEGDVAKLERSFEDLLTNEARRRASGVETTKSSVSEQIRIAFETIRKTNDFGLVLAESGDGKTRGEEEYIKDHPTVILYRTYAWSKDLANVQAAMFEIAGRKDYDGRTNRAQNTVRNMRGSDRLIIVDDAHKLTRPALSWWFDFHDATQCPIAMVGTFALLAKLEMDEQQFSRIGCKEEIVNKDDTGIDRGLIQHLIATLIPNANGETESLSALCEQVARERGHYRSVHKQLKLAAELKAGADKPVTYVRAFHMAHQMLVRNYDLN